jgi:class 3 adenylate cyclase
MDAPLQGERRHVTIIFADISGFTALNDAAKSPVEVEQVVGLINQLLQKLSEAIYEFDGYIDKYIGDAIMAVFGAPKAHEDDPERALRAALAMKDNLEAFNRERAAVLPEPLGIHMGINTGTVIAGMFGSDRKRSYTVMGDAVNVASRLEGVSERGEILVSEATYNLTNRLFVFEEREPVKVKGKQEALAIYEVKAARALSQTQRGLTDMEAPLIGRAQQMHTLLERYNQLQRGAGGIVAVVGEAGLGKSRLVAEFTRQVKKEDEKKETKSLLLLGRGLSYRQSFANRIFVDILQNYLALPENPDASLVKIRLEVMGDELFGPRKDEVVPYLATLLGLSPDKDVAANLPLNDPQILQQRTSLALGEWVEILASRQPVIIIFEDLHWADPSSVALIEYLLTLVLYNPILLIPVTRPDRESDFWSIKKESAQDYGDSFIELPLLPLTDDECQQVIQHLLKIEEMPDALEHLLLERAEGNPLFLEEVLRSLIEEGAIDRHEGHWRIVRSVTEINIPNTLQGVLTARIDRLRDGVRRVLQTAAVIGRNFSRSVLVSILNEPAEQVDQALDELEVAELIELRGRDPEPKYSFKHILTHETAYDSLLHQQRKVIHKQIADYMSPLYWQLGEEYAPTVAEHYYKSEVWPRAMRYFYRAAEAAIQSFANQAAVDFYTKTLEMAALVGPEADQVTIVGAYEGRAKTLARLGKPQQAITDYEAMLAKTQELKDDSAEMRALNGLGALLAAYYDYSQASEFFQRALAVARRIGDERGVADTLNQLGEFNYNRGELNLGVGCYQEAWSISQKLKDDARRTEAEDGLARIMLEQGEIAASQKRYTEIIAIRRRLGYRTGLMKSLSSLLTTQTFLADYAGANQTAEEALQLCHKSGDFYRAPLIKYYQGFSLLQMGELDQAAQSMQEGVELADQQRQKSWQALCLAGLSYYYLTVGLDEEGLRQAELSAQIAHELRSPLYTMRAQAVLGTACRHLSRIAEATQEFESVLAMAQKMGFVVDTVMILYQLTRAYIDSNAWEQAEQCAQRLLQLATTSDMKEYVTRGQWLQSLIEIYHQRYNTALTLLIDASNLAEMNDSRLSQYVIQIQKSYVYHISGNAPASRDAMIYAQKIQKRLLNALPSEATRKVFLSSYHAHHLQEMIEIHAGKAAPHDEG